MPERNWTPEQSEAIEYRGKNLLVSAGAGSGKTSVLVERVIRLVGAGERESDIGLDRLLIVTFTAAAASEMKERIAAALFERLERLEDSRFAAENAGEAADYLRRQLILLESASISTIHSFCLRIIKDNINLIGGLDSDFRLMDDAEASLLRADALDAVLEDKYAEGGDSFSNLVESFSMGRDDRGVAEIILRTHMFAQSAPWPDEWLESMAGMFDIKTGNEFAGSAWAGLLAEKLAGALDTLMAALDSTAIS